MLTNPIKINCGQKSASPKFPPLSRDARVQKVSLSAHSMQIQVIVNENDQNLRLDQFLNQSTGDEFSRTTLQRWLEQGYIKRSDGKILKPSYKVKLHEEYIIQVPPRKKIQLEPIAIDFSVVYEEEEFLIINKPAGIATHGSLDNSEPTLVNGLLYYFKNLSKIGGETRPGIVHRLDKPTSGLLIIAKTDKAHIALSSLFQKREMEKRYYAWLLQTPKTPEGTIQEKIARHPTERLKMTISEKGKLAITHYKVLKTISTRKHRTFSFVETKIETGRTHQIRVHFQHIKCPIVGDTLYSRSGNEFSKYGLLLFAQRLAFPHPFTKKFLEFELPLPENFLKFEKEAQFH